MILLGAILSGVAASVESYPLLLVGQIIFGFGSTSIETAQSKLYAFYTLGSGIQGFVFGLDIAIGRVWNLMGKLTSVPIMEGTGTWTWTIWVRLRLPLFNAPCAELTRVSSRSRR